MPKSLNAMLTYLDSLPLRWRMVGGSCVGWVLLLILTGIFVHETNYQSAWGKHFVAQDLSRVSQLSSLLAELSQAHLALVTQHHALKDTAQDQQLLQQREKQALDSIEIKGSQFKKELAAESEESEDDIALTGPAEHALNDMLGQYLKIAHSVVLNLDAPESTTDPTIKANAVFVDLQAAFGRFLQQQLKASNQEADANLQRNHSRTILFSLVAVLIGSALLLFTLYLSRRLSRSLEAQFLTLSELTQKAGGHIDAEHDKDEIERIAAAIDVFRTLLDKSQENQRDLTALNQKLQDAHDELEQRIAERTQALSITNADLLDQIERRKQAEESIQQAQAELVAAAHQAGKAEIATNVLHNVGNVLNSVNLSASLVSSQVRDSKAQGLAKAVQLINEHAADLGDFLTRDEKGKLLPGYLNKLVAALALEQQSIVEELGSLTRSIDHIKDIVTTQQSYAVAVSVVEAVHIRDLLEDALRMNAGALTRHQVAVVKEFADVPVLLLDKPRMLQILVNLIGNAKQAMDGVLDRLHRITLRVDIADGADGRSLRVRVEDEGEGIAPEHLARLFSHGFTTRKNGHGFGLHSCALAAKEMGATLTAHSDGPGKGAAFTLELPIKLVEDMQ